MSRKKSVSRDFVLSLNGHDFKVSYEGPLECGSHRYIFQHIVIGNTLLSQKLLDDKKVCIFLVSTDDLVRAGSIEEQGRRLIVADLVTKPNSYFRR